MFNARQKDFIGCLQTESGKRILKYLIEENLGRSVMSSDVNLTHYQLGRKELIEELVRTAKLTDKDIDSIQTIND